MIEIFYLVCILVIVYGVSETTLVFSTKYDNKIAQKELQTLCNNFESSIKSGIEDTIMIEKIKTKHRKDIAKCEYESKLHTCHEYVKPLTRQEILDNRRKRFNDILGI